LVGLIKTSISDVRVGPGVIEATTCYHAKLTIRTRKENPFYNLRFQYSNLHHKRMRTNRNDQGGIINYVICY